MMSQSEKNDDSRDWAEDNLIVIEYKASVIQDDKNHSYFYMLVLFVQQSEYMHNHHVTPLKWLR